MKKKTYNKPPSAVAKALSTPLFRQRVVKSKKGKGSFKRKQLTKDDQ